MDRPTAKRIAANEAHFRSLNEHMKGVIDAHYGSAPPEEMAFMCECGNVDCDAFVYLPRERYEAVRADPARFAVLPSHFIDGEAMIVETSQGFLVVEKVGALKQHAVEGDPRA